MDTRIKNFIALKRSNKSSPDVRLGHQATRDLRSASYGDAVPAVPSVFGAAPVKGNRAVESNSTKNGLMFAACPYEATKPGKPPTMGGAPLKGNGPVKLQTSRRLSSGELLQTYQDPGRTFVDLKNGDYVVGRKERRQSLQKSSPAQSPPLPAASASQDGAGFGRAQSPYLGSGVGNPARRITSKLSSNVTSPGLLPRSSINHVADLDRRRMASLPAIPPPMIGERPVPRRPSTQGHEDASNDQNATIKALWKAEYSRLVDLYGKDGVDRNIAEMNQTLGLAQPSLPDPHTFISDNGQRARGLSVDSNHSPVRSPSPTQMFHLDPLDLLDDSGIGFQTFSPHFNDASSTRSFSTVTSRISSEDHSSIQADHESFQSSAATSTKEHVRKVVEDMRSNYLRAIESTSKREAPSRQIRSSSSNSYHPAINSRPRMSKTTRQTWNGATSRHGGPVANPNSTTRKAERRSSNSSPKPEDTGSLARADSMTLGSMFPKASEPSSPPPMPDATDPDPGIPSTSALERDSESESSNVPDLRPTTIESFSTISSAPSSTPNDFVPPVDNYDIFHLPSVLDAKPPQSPEIRRASWSGDDETYDSEEAAPAPPSITWTPRKKASDDITLRPQMHPS